MENFKEPLTRIQLKGLAEACTNFMLDMHERHPSAYTRITTTPWGVSVQFSSPITVEFIHGVYAHQPLHNVAAHLDMICESHGWEPRILLPDWAK